MRRPQRGFTLIEMLVTALIMGLIGVATVALVGSVYHAQQTETNQSEANAYAQAAINEAMDRIRGAQPNGANGPIVLATANQIQFYDYYDQYDRTKTHTLVLVSYSISSGSLVRTIASAVSTVATPIAPGVTSLQFYYRVSGSTSWSTSAATPANVVAVSCTATVGAGGLSRAITGTVQLRAKGAA